jgi:hypothetical protein
VEVRDLVCVELLDRGGVLGQRRRRPRLAVSGLVGVADGQGLGGLGPHALRDAADDAVDVRAEVVDLGQKAGDVLIFSISDVRIVRSRPPRDERACPRTGDSLSSGSKSMDAFFEA